MSEWADACRSRVGSFLEQRLAFASSAAGQQRLFDAVNYSILNGGKRIRASLVYAAAHACGLEVKAQLLEPVGISKLAPLANLDRLAAAIECIHAYSLVHDDLPAMDDDKLRRGKPTCHIAFDEATAILAGDGLQSLAFELITETTLAPNEQIELVRVLAIAAGNDGMVGGQAIDIFHAENAAKKTSNTIVLAELEHMHALKTGALINASLQMGAIAAEADSDQLQALEIYGRDIGLAFQVQDDILDVISDTATLGKQQGADEALNKPTYPALLGLDQAKQKALELQAEALDALEIFGEEAEPLRELAEAIIKRKH